MKLVPCPISRQNNIVIQELKDEILIYDLSKNKAYCLNQTSAMVWQECDGTKSITDLSRILSRKTRSNMTEDIIRLALDKLKKEKLLSNGDEIEIKFEGLSRRQVIRKIGLASMVALPIVVGFIAPAAAQAQSCPPGRTPSGEAFACSVFSMAQNPLYCPLTPEQCCGTAHEVPTTNTGPYPVCSNFPTGTIYACVCD
jgi:hypothetical protein